MYGCLSGVSSRMCSAHKVNKTNSSCLSVRSRVSSLKLLHGFRFNLVDVVRIKFSYSHGAHWMNYRSEVYNFHSKHIYRSKSKIVSGYAFGSSSASAFHIRSVSASIARYVYAQQINITTSKSRKTFRRIISKKDFLYFGIQLSNL
jgi:hypothetical protein